MSQNLEYNIRIEKCGKILGIIETIDDKLLTFEEKINITYIKNEINEIKKYNTLKINLILIKKFEKSIKTIFNQRLIEMKIELN